ncbi:MAG TPA: transcription elongation factor Spt5 [Candidatus Thalassarchaeaceae archaeon]|jgi:transcriptional antiterminator NusG|nr:transcription elongation factor Spt5 [Candidatus Thalassarchaeaceae archaeon]
MSNAFVIYLRNEEKVLLLKRDESVSEFPLAWDGIFGVGDALDLDVVFQRITEATGIEADKLTHVRTGQPRGLAFGNRLNEVTPVLVATGETHVVPAALYSECEWIDAGDMRSKDHSIPSLVEMYGDVGSYLYILKTSIGQEANVANEIRARLSGSGSLADVVDEIYAVLQSDHMRGYIFVEASAQHHVEKLIGRAGNRTTPLKNCRKCLDGEAPFRDIFPHLEPKAATAGISEGDIVEVRLGAFKGQRARVTNIADSKEEITVELFDAPVPIPLTVRADQIRVTQRVE